MSSGKERISIWVPVSKREFIEDYHKTLSRNGTNLTKQFWVDVENYMSRHFNEAQTSIDSFSDKKPNTIPLIETHVFGVFNNYAEWRDIQFSDILLNVKALVDDGALVLPISKRIEKKLRDGGRKVWR